MDVFLGNSRDNGSDAACYDGEPVFQLPAQRSD
jgi:hypothetical protein